MRYLLLRAACIVGIFISGCRETAPTPTPVEVATSGVAADGALIVTYPLLIPIVPGSDLARDAESADALSRALDKQCQNIPMTSELDGARIDGGCPRQNVAPEAVGVNQ